VAKIKMKMETVLPVIIVIGIHSGNLTHALSTSILENVHGCTTQ